MLKKYRLEIKVIAGVVISIVLMYLAFISAVINSKKIDAIYIAHYGMGNMRAEYKIDLKNKMFWENTLNKELIIRDEGAPNEGYVWGHELSFTAINKFNYDSMMHGIHYLNEYYTNNILHGHQWHMIIYYSDGTEKNVIGDNNYPEMYDMLEQDFLNLVGKDIF